MSDDKSRLDKLEERLDRQLRIHHQIADLQANFLHLNSMVLLMMGGNRVAAEALPTTMQILSSQLAQINALIVKERDAAGIEKLSTEDEKQRDAALASIAVGALGELPPEMRTAAYAGLAMAVEQHMQAREEHGLAPETPEAPEEPGPPPDTSWVDKLYDEHHRGK